MVFQNYAPLPHMTVAKKPVFPAGGAPAAGRVDQGQDQEGSRAGTSRRSRRSLSAAALRRPAAAHHPGGGTGFQSGTGADGRAAWRAG